jgi:zinc transport system permease protein
MGDFIRALVQYEFLRNALLTGLLASVVCGIIGTFVVVRRITFVADGIAHCVLGGMGVAYFIQKMYFPAFHPFYGAVIAALGAALLIGFVRLHAREREDTVIGALWAVGMAVGVLFMAKTPGYGQDLSAYLFGDILMITSRDLWTVAGLDLVVITLTAVFYNPMLAVCFDEEFARLRGVPVQAVYMLMLCLTALTVVVLATVVGVVMVVALLTLPTAVAGQFTHTMRRMMVLAVLVCVGVTAGGLYASYTTNLPSGATIIVLAGALYAAVLAGRKLLRRKASAGMPAEG